MAQLATADALRDATILREAGILETAEVLVAILGPELGVLLAAGLERALHRHDELAVDLPLKVDDGQRVLDRLLERDELELELVSLHAAREVRVRGLGHGLDVHGHGLLEIVHVALLVGLGHEGPSFFVALVRHAREIHRAVVRAFKGDMTLLLAIVAFHRRPGRAFLGRMTLLFADAASPFEHDRLRALGLGVAGNPMLVCPRSFIEMDQGLTRPCRS